MKQFSHTDGEGKARMVNVGGKPDQQRLARAEGFIHLQEETLRLIRDNEMKKGDVLSVSEIAGIQASKRTGELIPLCHTIPLTHVSVRSSIKENGVYVTSEVQCAGKTGVEMEALTAVSTALLTVYDMCKAVDRNMQIDSIRLVEKRKDPAQ
ncbi:MAG: cyclic pyranopterin monophosphate synthase MoaC [Bacteroidales bacterium]|nr:cyclic pyranopterin monophosphate synthase MoaC [Bacteroidales bacterium]